MKYRATFRREQTLIVQFDDNDIEAGDSPESAAREYAALYCDHWEDDDEELIGIQVEEPDGKWKLLI